MSVRCRSSCRPVCTQRSMIEFMRGIWTPLDTVSIPASMRMVSTSAGYLPSRKLAQVVEVRSGAGSIAAWRRISHTVEAGLDQQLVHRAHLPRRPLLHREPPPGGPHRRRQRPARAPSQLTYTRRPARTRNVVLAGRLLIASVIRIQEITSSSHMRIVSNILRLDDHDHFILGVHPGR
jgi:hypothetical protein